MPALKAIPTNVITGFLGVGKTTAIMHLLEQKPEDERWAVLVNEFGEVGIDGALFAETDAQAEGVFIREVPGGCMCCAAGVPMQVALNRLLTDARPDRLLIEPTGLGHPREVLGVLGSEQFREVLDLRATVTLVDARKIRDSRYTGHEIFNQQLEIADVVVANKADQYQPGDYPALLEYLEQKLSLTHSPVFKVSQGGLRLEWLAASAGQSGNDHDHHQEASAALPEAYAIPEQGYQRVDNQGEGFYSCGWVFSAEWVFNAARLRQLLEEVDVERVKGVLITDRGVVAYNKSDGMLTETVLDSAPGSRIECISVAAVLHDDLENALLGCVSGA